ncbi:flavin reductase family protein [Cellulomonas sp. NPDC057328]|uniref:flavin reductase family protein n=1 Tax=Cellulomonas sp. NPDC057328 TaxID=3346101 RepID=UPI0036384CD9
MSTLPILETLDPTSIDARALRRVFACFPSGVTAICGVVDGVPVGMAASSFTSVSIDPPLVSVCVDNGSTTWPVLRGAGAIGVSVLGEGQDAVCRQLASRGGDRFAGLETHRTAEGAVLLGGSAAWLHCTVEDELPAGDHHIVLLRVQAYMAEPGLGPLVFHGSTFRVLQARIEAEQGRCA